MNGSDHYDGQVDLDNDLVIYDLSHEQELLRNEPVIKALIDKMWEDKIPEWFLRFDILKYSWRDIKQHADLEITKIIHHSLRGLWLVLKISLHTDPEWYIPESRKIATVDMVRFPKKSAKQIMNLLWTNLEQLNIEE